MVEGERHALMYWEISEALVYQVVEPFAPVVLQPFWLLSAIRKVVSFWPHKTREKTNEPFSSDLLEPGGIPLLEYLCSTTG